MPLELPSSLSPSKVSSFSECALAFRFSAIDRLPDPPTVATVKGTLVHSALELLMLRAPEDRTPATAVDCLDEAGTAIVDDPEFRSLDLDTTGRAAMTDDARRLVERYFTLEDPTSITPIGLELKLDVQLDGLRLRGIIDRLEVDDDGELVVTDYKTGRAPGQNFEQSRLTGVHFYAFLCERVLGRRPAHVQLLYLADPVAIVTVPTEQSVRALERKVRAIWSADRTGLRTRRFPSPHVPTVRLLRLPGLLPGLRRGSRGGPQGRPGTPRCRGQGRHRSHGRGGHRRPRSIARVITPDLQPDQPRDDTTIEGEADPLPPQNLLDAGIEQLAASHPALPLPHHRVDPPSRRSAVHRFDDAVDRAFDRLRGTEPADRILYSLTELGDFGLVWMLIGFTKGLRSDAGADAAFRLALALGTESVVLNGLIKSQFKRERPVAQEPRPYHIRIPLTTSFPSGHASTAMVAALLLTQDSHSKVKPLYFGLAGLIAASRVHVRIHHTSDVVGGIVVGTGLGLLARRVWPLRRAR